MKTFLTTIKIFIFIIAVFTIQLDCVANTGNVHIEPQLKQPFMTGLDVLLENNCSHLKGKKVGLITNQTGVTSKMVQNIDAFTKSENVDLKAIFSPEHGLFGSASAGEKIYNKTDSIYGIPLFSLYGNNKKPSKDMLKNLDILVFDIQDIGIRSYTYISTMGLAMEAAQESGLEFMVLDRPNPLGLKKIEGNILSLSFKSFIGRYPIPYVHGLTSGELAKMINEQGWLEGGKCNLKIIKMKNYDRNINYNDLGLHWVPTSPHVPNANTPLYMVATGIVGELGYFSNGVGYTAPFMTLGAPWINANQLAEKMNLLGLEGVIFRPVNYKPYYANYKGDNVGGIHIHITNQDKIDLILVQFYFMQEHNKLYPSKNPFMGASETQLKMFDKAVGNDTIRKTFEKNFKVEDIKRIIKNGLDDYIIMKKQYHLYD